MNVLFYRVNVSKDYAVGAFFPSFSVAEKWIENHPREGGYYSIEAILEK